ncbi:hypothetical protein [Geobacter sp. DSM 9736]|uniref:hypothetical protein n=1 Tax=Geobacter sp. DSM 9736 TaxID=1277350 RepID=UPI000B505A57|nr:hypothetical protein [Geobacter sp. DSM 9736]SNB47099.1 hypothetical protein SAMN06269301_2573 [Geobacter sp. DSM 9736]
MSTKKNNVTKALAARETLESWAVYKSMELNSGCANQKGFIHESTSSMIKTMKGMEVWAPAADRHAAADLVSASGHTVQCKALSNNAAINKAAKRILKGDYGNDKIVIPYDMREGLIKKGVDPARLEAMPYPVQYMDALASKVGLGYGTLGAKIVDAASTGAVTGAAFGVAVSVACCSFEIAAGTMTPAEAAAEITKTGLMGGVTGAAYNAAITAAASALSSAGYAAAAAAVPGVGLALVVGSVVWGAAGDDLIAGIDRVVCDLGGAISDAGERLFEGGTKIVSDALCGVPGGTGDTAIKVRNTISDICQIFRW